MNNPQLMQFFQQNQIQQLSPGSAMGMGKCGNHNQPFKYIKTGNEGNSNRQFSYLMCEICLFGAHQNVVLLPQQQVQMQVIQQPFQQAIVSPVQQQQSQQTSVGSFNFSQQSGSALEENYDHINSIRKVVQKNLNSAPVSDEEDPKKKSLKTSVESSLGDKDGPFTKQTENTPVEQKQQNNLNLQRTSVQSDTNLSFQKPLQSLSPKILQQKVATEFDSKMEPLQNKKNISAKIQFLEEEGALKKKRQIEVITSFSSYSPQTSLRDYENNITQQEEFPLQANQNKSLIFQNQFHLPSQFQSQQSCESLKQLQMVSSSSSNLQVSLNGEKIPSNEALENKFKYPSSSSFNSISQKSKKDLIITQNDKKTPDFQYENNQHHLLATNNINHLNVVQSDSQKNSILSKQNQIADLKETTPLPRSEISQAPICQSTLNKVKIEEDLSNSQSLQCKPQSAIDNNLSSSQSTLNLQQSMYQSKSLFQGVTLDIKNKQSKVTDGKRLHQDNDDSVSNSLSLDKSSEKYSFSSYPIDKRISKEKSSSQFAASNKESIITKPSMKSMKSNNSFYSSSNIENSAEENLDSSKKSVSQSQLFKFGHLVLHSQNRNRQKINKEDQVYNSDLIEDFWFYEDKRFCRDSENIYEIKKSDKAMSAVNISNLHHCSLEPQVKNAKFIAGLSHNGINCVVQKRLRYFRFHDKTLINIPNVSSLKQNSLLFENNNQIYHNFK